LVRARRAPAFRLPAGGGPAAHALAGPLSALARVRRAAPGAVPDGRVLLPPSFPAPALLLRARCARWARVGPSRRQCGRFPQAGARGGGGSRASTEEHTAEIHR